MAWNERRDGRRVSATEAENHHRHGHRDSNMGKGGMVTLPFIMANEVLEKMATTGLSTNLIFYLNGAYRMSNTTAATVLLIQSSAANFLPILGAYLADAYFGRFAVLVLGSLMSMTGMTLLWLTAMLPAAHPPPCNPSQCLSPSASQYALLIIAFAILSLGTGGVRPCSMAFGADQLREHKPTDEVDREKKERRLQKFISWYYASVTLSFLLGSTAIAYVQTVKGWKIGFGVPVALMCISTVMFVVGSPLYIKMAAHGSVFTGFAQAAVAAYRNRRAHLPLLEEDGDWCNSNKGPQMLLPSRRLRFLNKACLVKDRTEDLNIDSTSKDPWRLSSVQYVENLKIVLRMFPIWSTGIIIATLTGQGSLQSKQAEVMERRLTSHFTVPASAFGPIMLLAMFIFVPIYDYFIDPFLARLRGRSRGLTLKQRIGAGLVAVSIGMAVAALVESKRRKVWLSDGTRLSGLWLVPQNCLLGVAEAFNAIGQVQFYFTELPKGTESMGMALFTFAGAVGLFGGAGVIQTVKAVTQSMGGGINWLDDDLNRGHYDYYHWLLAVLGLLNVAWFCVCSWWYGKEGNGALIPVEEEEEHRITNLI